VKELVAVLWLLDRMNWQGHVEFDNHILRTDTAPGKDNSSRIRMDFIRQNVENYRMAEKKAREIGADADLAKLMAGLWEKEPGLAKTLAGGDPASILKAAVDYERVNTSALQIGRLDAQVTKKLLGM
jgi:hypothetical protein